jgi:hypothetical protein
MTEAEVARAKYHKRIDRFTHKVINLFQNELYNYLPRDAELDKKIKEWYIGHRKEQIFSRMPLKMEEEIYTSHIAPCPDMYSPINTYLRRTYYREYLKKYRTVLFAELVEIFGHAVDYSISVIKNTQPICGSCNTTLIIGYNYCPYCGEKVCY